MFLYRELRRFSNNTSQRLWLNLVKLLSFFKSEVFVCKRRFGWLGLCDASRSISLSSRLAFTGWNLIELCRLKGNSGVLEQFKVSDEMSKVCFWDSNNWLIRCFNVCCLNQSYGLRKCAPACSLRKCAPAWTNVSRLRGVNVSCIHLSCQENCWLMVNSMA